MFAQEADFSWEESFTLSRNSIEISASYNIDLSIWMYKYLLFLMIIEKNSFPLPGLLAKTANNILFWDFKVKETLDFCHFSSRIRARSF